MPTKITTFRLEDPYLEALDALAEVYGLNGRAEVIRKLLRRVDLTAAAKQVDRNSPAAAVIDRAVHALAALREQP